MEIYIVHTTINGEPNIPSVFLNGADAAEGFDRQTEYLTIQGGNVARESFEYQPTVSVDMGDGLPPVEIPNPRPQVIERARIQDADGHAVATVELYLTVKPAAK